MKILFVTEYEDIWRNVLSNHEITSPADYLQNLKYTESEYRVINLSKNYNYQSIGYYVSLLAQARGHKVIPSVMTVRDIKDMSVIASLDKSMTDEIQKKLKSLKSNSFVLSVYFGQNMAARYSALCHKLYCEFPLPMFRVTFNKRKLWYIQKIQVLTIDDIVPSHHEFLKEAVKIHCGKRFQRRVSSKNYHYDIAMLHNPDDVNPPSNQGALQKFIQAGDRIGLYVDLITKDDYKILGEYDGLFIRETTAVNHHTYRFARKALAERILVVDDPESILKCTNKVYMAEYLKKNNINSPETLIISKRNYKEFANLAKYPCVLKKPDGSSSIGVKKVDSKDEYLHVIGEYFEESDLLIAQDFMPSEYDWRIGIIGNTVFYACRYFMAKDHWQIFNWASKDDDVGKVENVPVEEVPEAVKKIALKAVSKIGSGLYGVDIKVFNGKPYVIEINDNPSMDAGYEDNIIGDQLYLTVMNYFLKNLNKLHGHDT